MTSAFNQANGGARIDTEQLLSSGVLIGPHRRTRPLTVSPLQRLARRIRFAFLNWRTL